MSSASEADTRPIFFQADRIARCRATLARDLAASATDRNTRMRHLADAARYAQAARGSLNETLLIRR
jgi:hypothetical protein